jgi:hypothetical protein
MKSKVFFPGLLGLMLLLALAFTGCPQTNDPPADSVVTLTAITGVTAPATGGTPVTVLNETAQYTGVISWAPAPAGTFAASTVYTAVITLTAKTGFTFNGLAANAFTVPGATATSTANSGTVTAVFPATAAAEPAFTASTNDSTANDAATLGLVGTGAVSGTPGVATAAIEGGKIKITSVSQGTAVITVSDASSHSATIAVTVAAGGAITIGTITKYVSTNPLLGVWVDDPDNPITRIVAFTDTGSNKGRVYYSANLQNGGTINTAGEILPDILNTGDDPTYSVTGNVLTAKNFTIDANGDFNEIVFDRVGGSTQTGIYGIWIPRIATTVAADRILLIVRPDKTVRYAANGSWFQDIYEYRPSDDEVRWENLSTTPSSARINTAGKLVLALPGNVAATTFTKDENF